MRWVLSGRKDLPKYPQRFILYTKWRMQQLFISGMKVYKQTMVAVKARNQPKEYQESVASIKLNKIKESK